MPEVKPANKTKKAPAASKKPAVKTTKAEQEMAASAIEAVSSAKTGLKGGNSPALDKSFRERDIVRESKIRRATAAFTINVILFSIFAAVFAGGAAVLIVAVYAVSAIWLRAIVSLIGIAMMVTGAILALYFLGGFLNSRREMKDPNRIEILKDEAI